MISARAFPDAQPARWTISSIREGTSTRGSGPAAPTVVQAGGDHETSALVFGRELMFLLVLPNVGALSLAWPATVSVVDSEGASSTVNWTCASRMLAPEGTAMLTKRIPTVWFTVPSVTSSRSELV